MSSNAILKQDTACILQYGMFRNLAKAEDCGAGDVAHQISPSVQIAVPPPRKMYDADLMDALALERFNQDRLIIPELNVYQSRDVQVTGNYLLKREDKLFDAGLRPLPDSGLPQRLYGSIATLVDRDAGSYLYDASVLEKDKIIEPAFLFASSGDQMHHHWLFDVCSRLYVWEVLLQKSVKLAVPAHLKAYQLAVYHDLGITDDDLVYFDTAKETTFAQLYYSQNMSQVDWCFPAAFTYLRERFFEAYKIKKASVRTNNNIFVTRQDMPDDDRPLLNEKQLIARVGESGFKSMAPGDLSFREQVELLSSANICAIVHGSGGANVLFGNDHIKCIHLHPDCVGRFRAHGRINAVYEQPYDYVFGPSFQRRERYHINPWIVNGDFLADSIGSFDS